MVSHSLSLQARNLSLPRSRLPLAHFHNPLVPPQTHPKHEGWPPCVEKLCLLCASPLWFLRLPRKVAIHFQDFFGFFPCFKNRHSQKQIREEFHEFSRIHELVNNIVLCKRRGGIDPHQRLMDWGHCKTREKRWSQSKLRYVRLGSWILRSFPFLATSFQIFQEDGSKFSLSKSSGSTI